MVMQDKNKQLKKITNYCFAILIFGYMILSILKIPTIIINAIMGITSCVLYGTILTKYKLEHNKIHNGLFLLGIICMIGSIICIFITSKYISILSTIFVYIFYIYNQKLVEGTWNKFLIFFGTFVVTSSFLSIYFQNKLITALFLIMELIIYGRLINKVMFSIGMKRKKKLEAEGFTNEDAKKVPLIKRILFGKTGKLDWTIVEMLTGKNFSKKTKNKS